MTENKPYYAYNDYHAVEIWQGSRDTGKYICSIDSETEADMVCELLNEVVPFYNLARDYNIPFNKLIDTFEDALSSDTIADLETEVAKLKEENEQLKSQMDSVHTKSNLKAINSHKKTMGLMEENEWLKQQLKEFKGDVE